MSIATRITSIENHLKDDYTEIARLGADLTNVDKNIENIAEAVREAYSKLPKVLGTGSNLSLSPTLKGGLDITPIGACEQDTIAYIDVGTWEQGTINSSGINQNSDTNVRTTDYISVKPNILYNISRTISTSYMAFRFYDSNKTYLGNQSSINITTDQSDGRMLQNVSSMTLTINDTSVAYLRMIDASNDTSTQYIISTQAPTPDYPQDIRVVTGDNEIVVQNKNLCNSVETHKGWSDYNTSVTSNNFLGIEDFTNVTENTSYTVSFEHDNPSASLLVIYVDSNNQTIGEGSVNLGTARTFTTPQNTAKVAYWLYISTGFSTIGGWIQLEYGSIATDYVPHAEQSTTLHFGSNYLAGIGEYDDTIEGTKDNWKIVRNVGKKTLDGSENWNIANNFYYLSNAISGFAYTEENQAILCNLFKWGDIGGSNSNLGFRIVNNNVFRGREATMKSVSDWKTYLSLNNLLLCFALATQTETPITSTSHPTLFADLNNMYNAMGYDGQTNITISSNSANAQMTAQVKALKGE